MPSYGNDFEDRVFAGWDELDAGKKNKKFDKAVEIFVSAWNDLPEPKYSYNESFLIAEWMLEIAVLLKDEKMMREWIPHVLGACLDRADIGEREEYVGEAYFELGELDKALEYFSIGVKKSRGGRCFAGRDNKYKKFYLENK